VVTQDVTPGQAQLRDGRIQVARHRLAVAVVVESLARWSRDTVLVHEPVARNPSQHDVPRIDRARVGRRRCQLP
jgi:hypothetical protein